MAGTQISAVCDRCGQVIEGPNSVTLWDGYRHCRSCLEEIAPELIEHARSHDRLVEDWPFGEERFPRRWRFAAISMGIMCAIAAALSISIGWPYAMVAVLSWGIAYLSFHAAAWWMARSQPAVVSVSDGVVELQTRYAILRRRLDDCRWSIGRLPRSWEIPANRDHVLLEFRMTCCGIPIERHVVPCGFSESTQRLWTSFLSVSRVPQGRPPLSMAWGSAIAVLFVVVLIAALHVGRALLGAAGLAISGLVVMLPCGYAGAQSLARLGGLRAALSIGLAFAAAGCLLASAVGVKYSLGLAALASIAGIYAAVGLVVAWDVSRRLARANAEQPSAAASLSSSAEAGPG